jgi:hypothetical protein
MALSNDVSLPDPRGRTNLPLQLTTFFGRERELHEVKRLLDRGLGCSAAMMSAAGSPIE